MEQLSLPYRVALVALLAVGTLYLLVLKPKDDTPAPAAATPVATQVAPSAGPTAPGVKGLSTAVQKARGAAATQAGSDAATQAATGGATTSTTATPGATAATTTNTPAATPAATASPAAKPAAATAAQPVAATPAKAKPSGDPSAPLLASLGRGHTVVVLFAGKTAKDDAAVRRAVKGIDRRGGKVDVHVVPLTRVGRYEAITRGVTVRQAPTVLVIGKSRAARTLVGFTTTAEVDQLVGDVRRGF